jgi:hypothetical protein
MADDANSNSSRIFVFGLLAIAVVALVLIGLAYFNANQALEVLKTNEVAMQEQIDKLQNALEEEQKKALVFEYNEPFTGGEPLLYVQVQANKKILFFNNTKEDTLLLKPDSGLFSDVTGTPTIGPQDNETFTVSSNVTESQVFTVEATTADGTDHGSGEMIVGSGP